MSEERNRRPNETYLRGNLGADPEARTFGSGTKKVTLRMAVNEKWKDKQSGEERQATNWFDVECWGDLADRVLNEFKKGSYVQVEGSLATDTWDDKTTGQKRTKTFVKAFSVTAAGRDQEGAAGGGQARAAQAERPAKKREKAAVPAGGGDVGGEEIPF
jgi:single-strand DNA-binding protein